MTYTCDQCAYCTKEKSRFDKHLESLKHLHIEKTLNSQKSAYEKRLLDQEAAYEERIAALLDQQKAYEERLLEQKTMYEKQIYEQKLEIAELNGRLNASAMINNGTMINQNITYINGVPVTPQSEDSVGHRLLKSLFDIKIVVNEHISCNVIVNRWVEEVYVNAIYMPHTLAVKSSQSRETYYIHPYELDMDLNKTRKNVYRVLQKQFSMYPDGIYALATGHGLEMPKENFKNLLEHALNTVHGKKLKEIVTIAYRLKIPNLSKTLHAPSNKNNIVALNSNESDKFIDEANTAT